MGVEQQQSQNRARRKIWQESKRASETRRVQKSAGLTGKLFSESQSQCSESPRSCAHAALNAQPNN